MIIKCFFLLPFQVPFFHLCATIISQVVYFFSVVNRVVNRLFGCAKTECIPWNWNGKIRRRKTCYYWSLFASSWASHHQFHSIQDPKGGKKGRYSVIPFLVLVAVMKATLDSTHTQGERRRAGEEVVPIIGAKRRPGFSCSPFLFVLFYFNEWSDWGPLYTRVYFVV